MKISTLLQSCAPPWVFRIPDRALLASHLEDAILFDGGKMSSINDMFRVLVNNLKLPNYFGWNYNALDEMLCDLEWLPKNNYVLFFYNVENFLYMEKDQALRSLLNIFISAGEEWSRPVDLGERWDRPAIPFHVIFEAKPENIPDPFGHRDIIEELPELRA